MKKPYILVKHYMKRESITEGFLINPQSLWVDRAKRAKDNVWNGKIREVVCFQIKGYVYMLLFTLTLWKIGPCDTPDLLRQVVLPDITISLTSICSRPSSSLVWVPSLVCVMRKMTCSFFPVRSASSGCSRMFMVTLLPKKSFATASIMPVV